VKIYWSGLGVIAFLAVVACLATAFYFLLIQQPVSKDNIIAFATLASALAVVLVFAKSVQPQHSDQKEATTDSEADQSRENNLTGVSPDFTALINAIRNEAKANRGEERREDGGKAFREKITIGLITATVIAVGWQVHEMIKVYGPIKEQADATQKQVEISSQAIISGNRAWVGPQTATLNPVQKDKGFVGVIQYQNTGKEPATDFSPNITVKTYSEDDWKNGAAITDINSLAKDCLAISTVPPGLGVVYPTSGFSNYQLHFDTGQEPGPQTKIIADDSMTAGHSIFKIQGCFVYRSVGAIHHTAFCFYYQANFTLLPNMNICTVGNAAD